MKTRHFYPLLFLILLLSQIKASAQQEVKRTIEFRLTDPATKTSHTYRLNGANYLLSNPLTVPTNGQQTLEASCSINLDLAQEVDQFLLKWVSGEIKDAIGVITLVSTSGSGKARSLVFTVSKVVGSSENFISADVDTSTQISLFAKKVAVDDTIVFTVAKPYKID
jgi:hypothetical protein